MDKFMQLLAKKKKQGKEMSDMEKEAKGTVLGSLKDMAEQMMGDKVKGLKKVTVASDSPEGLEEGLDKAKDTVDEMHSDRSPQDLEEESADKEDDMDDMFKDKSPEEMDEVIAKLMKLKEEKLKA